MLRGRRLICLVSLLWYAAACTTPVGVRRQDPETVQLQLAASTLTGEELSQPTRNVLQARSLASVYADDPDAAITALHQIVADGQGGSDVLFALAELSFQRGKDTRDRRQYRAAAIYAYAFLFPGQAGDAPGEFDPRLRVAADLYNRALTAGLEPGELTTVSLQSGAFALPFGEIDVTVDPESFRWSDRWLVRFTPVADYEVRGLHNRYRWPGIGAPLAADTVRLDAPAGAEDLVAERLKVPVTAVLRLEQPREQLTQRLLHGRIDLYADLQTDSVEIDGRTVPLEIESTAVLAATLQESPLWDQELTGFLGRIVRQDKPAKLRAIRPYRSDRIPVVFVHGTASSPGRWADMFNDLANDRRISSRYQFWFFQYDTGNPIAYSAYLLRSALTNAVKRLDPDGRDPCLREMVVIGHSQGGLLTKMTAIDSGDQLWTNVSDKPVDQLGLSPANRALLEQALFVKPLPFVRRVIFIATPHRGSFQAGRWIATQVGRLVTFPVDVAQLGQELLSTEKSPFRSIGRIPSSVDNMSPRNPFIHALATIPVAPGVASHSIIAVQGDGPVEDGSDGVVEYKSAHIDGVESELVVRSGHSTQSDPRSIEEVRRILLAHAGASSCAPPPATAARAGSGRAQ
jgi:pimeloyl-ACP methyl ester carboxylesterase